MHPVEEDSRFAIQPVYPDRQALCAEGEEHGKKNNLLLLEQVVEMVQKYWICYLVTGIFKQFHGTDIGCVR
jgi:hypothetical protein